MDYVLGNQYQLEAAVLVGAAQYLGVREFEIALTDSTTMGLGLLYGGLDLREGDEVLTTTHDHIATHSTLDLATRRAGSVKKVSLYTDSARASVDEIIENMLRGITPATRILAVTWVHSSTGVCLPIRAMADALKAVNANRDEQERVVLCVDGVHGLGVKDVFLPSLGCDFFVAGTHKWMFGPRGTGFVWGRTASWKMIHPITSPWSSFGHAPSRDFSPGGYHSFEHRWSLNEAFRFHQAIGKANVAQRIAALNRGMKEELSAMKHVSLRTPMSEELSGGIVSFDVAGRQSASVVSALRNRGISASAMQHVRFAGGLLTVEEDIERALREVAALA
jgi:selenocysteine lyase/cysteine desulfurase